MNREKKFKKLNFKLKKESLKLFLFFLIFYIFFQVKTIYGGDSGDLVTAAWLWGIPHPPGYPLYTFITSILIHSIPFYTPAWRAAFLSSFPAALTIALLYSLVFEISKSKKSALFSCLTLGFIYPFWLYAEVAEVFSLNSLFAVLLLLFFIKFFKSPNFKTLFFLIFTFSLALTHHHTILIVLPSIIFVWYKSNKKIKLTTKQILYLILGFILGLCIYIYPLFACQKKPLVCWINPTNFTNLVQLVTRANYGSFKANLNIGNVPLLRFLSVLSFLKMAVEDFSIIGVILIILGIIGLFRKNKSYFYLVAGILLTSLFFIFYASFLLASDFLIATFERFVILPYIFMSLLAGLGLTWLLKLFRSFLKKLRLSSAGKELLLSGITITMFIVPISIGILNYKKISLLKNDMTAENLIKSLLKQMPPNSIFITYSDNISFNSQYVIFSLKHRTDVKLIAYNLLNAPFYQEILRKTYPNLIIPTTQDKNEAFFHLVEDNSAKHSIFVSDARYAPISKDDNWLPKGLIWTYNKKGQDVDIDLVIDENTKIWNKIDNPFKNKSKLYENLFLADNFRIYNEARVDYATWLYMKEKYELAQTIFKEIEENDSKETAAIIGQGAIYLKKNQCQQAQNKFEQAKALNQSSLVLGYLRKTALECFNDPEQAKIYEDQCVQQETKDFDLGQDLYFF